VAVAVDPSESAVRMLRRMARLNATGDRLRIIRAAVAAAEGVTDVVDAGVVAAGYAVRPGAAHPASERTVVPAVTVDGLCARLELRPTHLKIDVEGFEADVLRGARATLRAADRPLVFIELHHEIVRQGGSDPAAAIRELQDARYGLFDVYGAPAFAEALLSQNLVRVVARPHAAPAV
jgi:FkbM family methyltransferase